MEYSTSPIMLDGNIDVAKKAAFDYQNQRSAYKKEVSRLRKEYATEYAKHVAAEKAKKASLQQNVKRRTLEHQRLKNIRSAESALKEIERKKQRDLEFQQELNVAQENRLAREERFRKARQILIDELEEEAHLWLTTPEEVEAAFTPQSQQELWARPNSALLAPIPTQDSVFWNLQSHTWRARKSYPTKADLLFENLMERVYDESNIDPTYWTPERVRKRVLLEQKAKLRALVMTGGRRALLLKQRNLLNDLNVAVKVNGREIPSKKINDVPSSRVFVNYKAMEKEGVKLLMKDPRLFFHFENEDTTSEMAKLSAETFSVDIEEYSGPPLGAPTGIKDFTLIDKEHKKAFPLLIGKLPPPDTRTAREKKRDAKKKAMMAAAVKSSESVTQLLREPESRKPVTTKESNWERPLDAVADKHLLAIPPQNLFTPLDLEEFVSHSRKKLQYVKSEIDFLLNSFREETKQQHQTELSQKSPSTFNNTTSPPDDDNYEKPKFNVMLGGKIVDLESLGIDPEPVDRLYSSLTKHQLVCIRIMDRKANGATPLDQLRSKLESEVPDLTTEQIDAIVEFEEAMTNNKLVQQLEAPKTKAQILESIGLKEIDYGQPLQFLNPSTMSSFAGQDLQGATDVDTTEVLTSVSDEGMAEIDRFMSRLKGEADQGMNVTTTGDEKKEGNTTSTTTITTHDEDTTQAPTEPSQNSNPEEKDK
jgi:hypothetical protein